MFQTAVSQHRENFWAKQIISTMFMFEGTFSIWFRFLGFLGLLEMPLQGTTRERALTCTPKGLAPCWLHPRSLGYLGRHLCSFLERNFPPHCQFCLPGLVNTETCTSPKLSDASRGLRNLVIFSGGCHLVLRLAVLLLLLSSLEIYDC